MSLSQALLQLAIVSKADLENARARQELFGGNLLDHLLEVCSVAEGELLRALSQAYELTAAPEGPLALASPVALEAVGAERASELCVYPLAVHSGRITLVVSEPPPASLLHELKAEHGFSSELWVALHARVREAIARAYGRPLDRRSQRALTRLEPKATDPLVPRPLPFSQLPRLPSLAPVEAFPNIAEFETPIETALHVETAKAPPVEPSAAQHAAPATSQVVARTADASAAAVHPDISTPSGLGPSEAHAFQSSSSPVSSSASERQRGPYPAYAAQEDLQQARSPDQVLKVYFSFASQYFDHTAVFTVHGEFVQLRAARGFSSGPPLERERLPLERHPVLREVTQSSKWWMGALSQQDPSLALRLGIMPRRGVIALPVRLRQRVALVVLGGFDNGDVHLPDVGELLAFEPHVAAALGRVILTRKRRTDADPEPASS